MTSFLPATRLDAVLDSDPQETWEWLAAFDDVLHCDGPQRCIELLRKLLEHAQCRDIRINPTLNTPYCNTIARWDEPAYPGDLELEQKIMSTGI